MKKKIKKRCGESGSNTRPSDLQSDALPTELSTQYPRNLLIIIKLLYIYDKDRNQPALLVSSWFSENCLIMLNHALLIPIWQCFLFRLARPDCPLWRHYFPNKQGLIFVVDSNDRVEARDEFHSMLNEVKLKNSKAKSYLLFFFSHEEKARCCASKSLLTSKIYQTQLMLLR